MLKEFKEFAIRGNVADMAVGIIIGAAFTKLVGSLVADVIMPPIGLATGGLDFSEYFWVLSGGPFDSLAAAEAAGAPIMKYGAFITLVIDFSIVAFVVFMLIRGMNRLRRKAEDPAKPAPAPTTKNCTYCLSVIPLQATRCPHCTSQLDAAASAAG